ncbi:MAG: hypothetical protein ACTSU5_05620 [Promethearchaeota archaeon]
MPVAHVNNRTIGNLFIVSLLCLSTLGASQVLFVNVNTALVRGGSSSNLKTARELDPGLVQLDTAGTQPVGEINITDFEIVAGGMLDWGVDDRPNVTLTSWGVNKSAVYVNATHANYDSGSETAKFKVSWNETVLWQNTSTWASGQKIVNYTCRIFHGESEPGATLNGIWYNTSVGGPLVPFPEENYTVQYVSKPDGGYDYAVFDLQPYFSGKVNGSMVMTFNYTYEFEVKGWYTAPQSSESHSISNGTNNIVADFVTYFEIVGDEQLGLDLLYTPPDHTYLYNETISWKKPEQIYFVDVPSENHTILADNRIQILVSESKMQFNVTYLANYTLGFVNATPENIWSADRLVSGFNSRERDYIINASSGPAELLLGNIRFNSTIPHSSVQGYSDAFNRTVSEISINSTTIPNYESPTGGVLAHFILGYMKTGEVDKVTVQYTADSFLNVLIADAISFPLPNVEVVLYINGLRYGSKVSNEEVRPFPSLTTDSQGQVLFENVPNYQNYTVEVFQNGKSHGMYQVSPVKSLNFVVTEIPHFPIWIIVWASISVAVLCVGVVIYRKSQKTR